MSRKKSRRAPAAQSSTPPRPAHTQLGDELGLGPAGITLDSFQNFALSLGIGTDNASTGNTYGYNPITLNRTLLEWMYRGSWLAGVAVDMPADDMTRGGIDLQVDWSPEDTQILQKELRNTNVWGSMADTLKYGALYGGAIGAMLIDGQDLATPLNPESIAPGQFKGICPMDRWAVEVDPYNVVEEWGPHLGEPEYYTVRSALHGLPEGPIHYTRVLRVLGIKLPYWQAQMNNLWGMSIFEPIYDRLTGFDSATTGATQLVSKLWTRVYQVEGLRQIIATGGKPQAALMAQVDLMRRLQSNEGITLIDMKDNFIPHSQTVNTGVTDTLVQLGQQISGALQIPLVRLFGQSPTGLNSTGESDLRTYYDGILRRAERDLRPFLTKLLPVVAASIGKDLPPHWGFSFKSLWEMPDAEKAQVAASDTATTLSAFEAGVIGRGTVLKELRERGRSTGYWSNITDEEIEDAEGEAPPASAEALEEARQQGLEDMERQQAVTAENDNHAEGEPELSGKPREQHAKQRDGRTISAVGGVPVAVECERGAQRWPGSPHWPADYGYIRGTQSAEGPHEELDCFIGPFLESTKCWIFNHFDNYGGFEEHKVMLGYLDLEQAKRDYVIAYRRPVQGGVIGVPVRRLLNFLTKFNVSAPIVKHDNIQARDMKQRDPRHIVRLIKGFAR